MQLKIYTIYDTQAEWYSQPFFARANGEALRSFANICQDPKHAIGQHPSHYTLFEIGLWDDSKANIQMLQAKVSLGSGNEFQATEEQNLKTQSIQMDKAFDTTEKLTGKKP